MIFYSINKSPERISMFVQVKLLNGFPYPLWYKIPDQEQRASLVGSIVLVPLKNQTLPGMIVSAYESIPPQTFAIKEISSFQAMPGNITYFSFIKQLARYYQIDTLHLLRRFSHFITQKEQHDEETNLQSAPHLDAPHAVTLTDEQKVVVDFMGVALKESKYTPTLLHGVTGSGKTEVYKQLIIQAIEQGKSVMLFLPEISLAFQFEKLLRAQLPHTISIHSFHSGTPLKQKRLLWQELLEKKPVLIIGVHVPILLPIENLGLIIVDEEHEVGYQEKKHPKINTKEAALLRAQITNIPILLGSATPSIASLNQVNQKKWHFFQLTKRFAGAFPVIKTVLLQEKKDRKSFWFSDELIAALKDRLSKKEQSIIFINRRGHSFFVQCKQCSFIFSCSSCSVSLTLHDPDQLHCHYCGFSMQLPMRCSSCQAKGDQFLKKGIGTQQVVTILEKLFPQARIGRADLDVSSKKNLWKQTLTQFERGEIDILVGTQTITKGYHFPNVTLVGILWADLNLHFPIYNATETTLQQLIQVAGRAGRATQNSLVIVQAMINHPSFAYLNEVDYPTFYDYEIALRQETLYPPCIRLIELELKHTNDDIIDAEAAAIISLLQEHCLSNKLPIMVLGPAKPAVFKIKNVVSRKIYLKGADINQLIALFRVIDQQQLQSRIYFTPNPGS